MAGGGRRHRTRNEVDCHMRVAGEPKTSFQSFNNVGEDSTVSPPGQVEGVRVNSRRQDQLRLRRSPANAESHFLVKWWCRADGLRNLRRWAVEVTVVRVRHQHALLSQPVSEGLVDRHHRKAEDKKSQHAALSDTPSRRECVCEVEREKERERENERRK